MNDWVFVDTCIWAPFFTKPHARVLDDTVELHTVELPKYNVDERSLAGASEIEAWVFFLLHADRYDAEQLRVLLPEAPFQQAILAAEAIARKTGVESRSREP